MTTHGRPLRWEQELAYKELEIHLRRSPLLLGHTVVTAAQEIACLIIAQAIVARVRMTAAQSDDPIPVLEISFINTLNVFRALWFFTALFKDIPLQDIFPQLVSRALDSLAHQPSRPRRHRSCPRAVRQPIALGLACSETHRPLESFSMKSAANQPELPKGIGANVPNHFPLRSRNLHLYERRLIRQQSGPEQFRAACTDPASAGMRRRCATLSSA